MVILHCNMAMEIYTGLPVVFPIPKISLLEGEHHGHFRLTSGFGPLTGSHHLGFNKNLSIFDSFWKSHSWPFSADFQLPSANRNSPIWFGKIIWRSIINFRWSSRFQTCPYWRNSCIFPRDFRFQYSTSADQADCRNILILRKWVVIFGCLPASVS